MIRPLESYITAALGHLEIRLKDRKISMIEFRNAVIFLQAHLTRVNYQGGTEGEVMIAKGRAIKDAVASGEPLITSHKTPLGGSIRKKTNLDDLMPIDQPDLINHDLRKKWTDRTEDNRVFKGISYDLSKDYPGSPFKEIRAKASPAQTGVVPQLRCSFCGKETNHLQATISKTHQIFKSLTLTVVDGHDVIGDRISHSSNLLVACPDHANMIKAKVDKDGKVQTTVKFTSLEDC